MKTNPIRRTGLAAVLASGVAAGTMDSNNGKASVAPTPRRNVRRGMNFLVMKLIARSSVQTGFHDVGLTQIPSACDKENRPPTFLEGDQPASETLFTAAGESVGSARHESPVPRRVRRPQPDGD